MVQRLRIYFPVVIAALILASQLLWEPIAGMPDNGDFVNVTDPLRLVPAAPVSGLDRYFGRVVQHWNHDPQHHGRKRMLTSEWLLIVPAYWLTSSFANGALDLRAAGVVHSVVFLFVLLLVAPLIGGRLWLWGLILLVWCDAVYFCWFNSLYMDTAALLFLLLAAACYWRVACNESSPRWNTAGVLAALGLLLASKFQHALLLPLVLLWLWFDPRIRPNCSRALLAGWLGVMGACVWWQAQYIPEDYRGMAAYHVLFNEIAPKADDPVAALAEFDLDARMKTYVGTDAFESRSGLQHPTDRRVLLAKVTHGALLRYYLRHPQAALHMIWLGLRDASLEREPGYGNWVKEAGYPLRAPLQSFTLWSGIRAALWGGSAPLYLFQLLLVAIASWRVLGRQPVCWFLLAAGAFEFLVSVLADCKDTTRHLFLFRALVDLLLVSVVAVWLSRRHFTGLAMYTAYSSSTVMPRK